MANQIIAKCDDRYLIRVNPRYGFVYNTRTKQKLGPVPIASVLSTPDPWERASGDQAEIDKLMGK